MTLSVEATARLVWLRYLHSEKRATMPRAQRDLLEIGVVPLALMGLCSDGLVKETRVQGPRDAVMHHFELTETGRNELIRLTLMEDDA